MRSSGRCALLPSRRRPLPAARPAPVATGARRSCGHARSTSMPWLTRPRSRCSAISTTRLSTITACVRASFARTANFWSRPTGPTASSPRSRSSTRLASIRCSNTWSSFPMAACRRCRSPGTAGPKDKGGQRWFHLYPNEEIRHDDVLHWTKLNQNWNFMCAECHSTGVRKNYDAANDRFATTWAEISVGCEACHGQGSRHVALGARQQSWWPFGKTRRSGEGARWCASTSGATSTWPIDPNTGNAQRSIAPGTLRKEVETCGLCHARRGQFSETWVPGRWLSDTHVVSPTGRGLYHADGQMLDEVYNYGSFKQSKMFAAGVTCSDCHEPHSAKLRAVRRRRLPAMPRVRQVCGRRAPPPRGRERRRSPARRATCRRAPTWWSTGGTITASASRVPICR